MIKKQLSFLLIIVLIFSLCSCREGNSSSSESNSVDSSSVETSITQETISLNRLNINEYLRSTYIVTPNNLTRRDEFGAEYKAYTVEINFYPKKQNIKFENCVVIIKLAGLYNFTANIDESGKWQYRNQIWFLKNVESSVSRFEYYSIKGNVLIY